MELNIHRDNSGLVYQLIKGAPRNIDVLNTVRKFPVRCAGKDLQPGDMISWSRRFQSKFGVLNVLEPVKSYYDPDKHPLRVIVGLVIATGFEAPELAKAYAR
jgi:hypothetical protein